MAPTPEKLKARALVTEFGRKMKAGEKFTQKELSEFTDAIAVSKDTSKAQLARQMVLPAGWQSEFLPTVLLSDWRTLDRGTDCAVYDSVDGLHVLLSAAVELDGKRWLHASCSRKDHLPSWNDLRRVKDLFVGFHRTAIQILPKQEQYVNFHPRVLHLFSCLDEDTPVPDFTRGTDTL